MTCVHCAWLSDAKKIYGTLQNTQELSVLARLVLPSQGFAEIFDKIYANHNTDNVSQLADDAVITSGCTA